MSPQPLRFGRYELETRLGAGGMAEVWLVRQEGPAGFSKRAVIKRILPGLADDPDFIEMFLQEARLAALLNHPNAVQIFDLGEVDDSYFLVMEYIDGCSLRFLEKQSLALGKSLELGFVAFVLSGACAGLHHAHEQRGLGGEPLGLVHRDVAPDNLLVSYDGITKVIDFGIAKAFSDASRAKSGVIKGKYGYMSPEQVQGLKIDRRADVYSMGVVLFEALCGRRPFNGTPTEVLHAILEDPPMEPDELRPDLPAPVCDLVRAMLEKTPAARPQSIREVEVELLAIATSEGWGQTEVARVVRILGGVAGREAISTAPAASLLTRAARAQPIEPAPRTADFAKSPVEPTRTEEMDEMGALPLPGAGSIDASGRVHLNAPSPPVNLTLDEGKESSSVSPALPLELEYDRTELAASPSIVSMPPPPSVTLRSNVFSSVLRVGLILAACAAAIVGYQRWRIHAEAPTTVRLTIESRPTGGEIWIDGIPTGKYTPSVLNWDNQVSHVLLLKAKDRVSTSETVPAGIRESTVALDLAAVGRVRISSSPAGAKLSAGTEDLGVAPRVIELPADTPTKLTASLEDYLEASTSLTVVEGATVDWSPTLTPAGRLDVQSDPSDANVRLDGQLVGRTPLVLSVAAATPHLVQLEAAGLDPYKIKVNVELRGTKKLFAHLADREEHRLQTSLSANAHQIEDLQRQLNGLDVNASSEFFSKMAALKKHDAMQGKLDALLKRKDDLEGKIDAHRTELEDRTAQ